jgi:hypothetical protein
MFTSDTQITDALYRLRSHIDQVPARLTLLSPTELTEHLPGKWSRKEILGHLIDSAINNLKRFTDAQFADSPYPLQRYNQNKLVSVNQYQNLPLDHLLVLWQSLNRQILYVTEIIPADILTKPIQISQADTKMRSLAWLLDDYVAHLEHHLKTLL